MAAYIALEDAMRAGDLDGARASLGDDPAFPNVRDPYTDSPLMALALHWAPHATVAELLALGGDANFVADDGFPALVLVALHGRDDRHALMQLLIAAGADVDRRGLNDWTPLHAAAARDDPEAIALLLAAGADPMLRTRIDEQMTALEEAEKYGNHRAAAALRGA
jgi:ankyrin repeat protein